MAKLDFPGSPSANQKYPSPAVAGQPVYTWDGEKWTSIASQYVPGTAPFESAMAYSGMQINGGMEVSQSRGFNNPTSVNGPVCDGWEMSNGGTATVAASVLVESALAGFTARMNVAVSVAQPSLGAGDFYTVFQRIEGVRSARLGWGTSGAQPITISFWSGHHRIGTYSGSIRNATAYNRVYAFSYTQNVADVWEYKTVTVPGDITGTWPKDNTTGLEVVLAIACGTTYTASSANTWMAGAYLAAPGQINGVAATSDIFRITGVTVLPGTQAPTAAQSPNIMRPYGEELLTCKRYWERVFCSARFPATANSYMDVPVFWVEKRAVPTIVLSGGSNSNLAEVPLIANTTITGGRFEIHTIGAGDSYAFNTTLTADARL